MAGANGGLSTSVLPYCFLLYYNNVMLRVLLLQCLYADPLFAPLLFAFLTHVLRLSSLWSTHALSNETLGPALLNTLYCFDLIIQTTCVTTFNKTEISIDFFGHLGAA